MIEYGHRVRRLPAPPGIVWDSLADPSAPGARPWLRLDSGEVAPRVLEGVRPGALVWSSLWPSRPDDRIAFELIAAGSDTSLRFVLLTPDEPPDESGSVALRKRVSRLLFADLRHSYGQ